MLAKLNLLKGWVVQAFRLAGGGGYHASGWKCAVFEVIARRTRINPSVKRSQTLIYRTQNPRLSAFSGL